MTERKTAYNRRLAKKRVQWLIEHSTSYQILCWVDSLVLRNPLLRQAPNRYVKFNDMKTNIAIRTILIFILSFGCNNPKDEVPNNLTLDYYTSYEYNDKGKLVSTKTYSSTDSLRSIKTSTYNNEDRLIKEVDWQPEAGIIGVYEYLYDSIGNKRSQNVLDEKGRLLSKWEYLYNDNNKITTNIRYDGNNKIKARMVNCFDSIKAIRFVLHFDTTNIPKSIDSTIWISKNICKEINFKNNKSTVEYKDTYDDKKRLIESIQYDDNGNIIQKLKWENFVNDNAKTSTFYNSDNQITTFALDKYDEQGQLVKTEWYRSEPEK